MLKKKHNRYIFYHGTSTAIPIIKWILPPVYTQNKREHWRNKYVDKVFFTDSLLSAYKYARKACSKYGGEPIVYEVKPVGYWCNRISTEYIADKALVVGVHDKNSLHVGD